jgi:hypothetical protein
VRFVAATAVLVGHAITPLREFAGIRWFELATWGFAVPAFALMSGVDRARRLVRTIPLPRLAISLATTAQTGIERDTLQFFVVEPAPTLWFLLSLMFWRLAPPYAATPRHAFVCRWAVLAVGYVDGFGFGPQLWGPPFRLLVPASGLLATLALVRLMPTRPIPLITCLGIGGPYIHLPHPLILRHFYHVDFLSHIDTGAEAPACSWRPSFLWRFSTPPRYGRSPGRSCSHAPPGCSVPPRPRSVISGGHVSYWIREECRSQSLSKSVTALTWPARSWPHRARRNTPSPSSPPT